MGLRIVRVPVSVDAVACFLEAGLVTDPRDVEAVAQVVAELVEEFAPTVARNAAALRAGSIELEDLLIEEKANGNGPPKDRTAS